MHFVVSDTVHYLLFGNNHFVLTMARYRYVFLAGYLSVPCYSIATRQWRFSMIGHSKPVTSVCINPKNDTQLYSASLDGTVRLWEWEEGSCLRTIQIDVPVDNFCLSQVSMKAYIISYSLDSADRNDNEKEIDKEKKNATRSRFMELDLQRGNLRRLLRTKTELLYLQCSSQGWVVFAGSKHLYMFSEKHHPSTGTPKDGSSIVRVTLPNRISALCIAANDNLPSSGSANVPEDGPTTSSSAGLRVIVGDVSGRVALYDFDAQGRTTSNDTASSTTAMLASAAVAADLPTPTAMMHWHATPVSWVLAPSALGPLVLSGAGESVVVEWNSQENTRRYLPRLGGPHRAALWRMSPLQGSSLFARCLDGRLQVISLASRTLTHTLYPPYLPSNGRLLGGMPNNLAVMNPSAPHDVSASTLVTHLHASSPLSTTSTLPLSSLTVTCDMEQNTHVFASVLSQHCLILAVESRIQACELHVFSRISRALMQVTWCEGRVTALVASPTSELLAAIDTSGHVFLFARDGSSMPSVALSEEEKEKKGLWYQQPWEEGLTLQAAATGVAFSPDGSLLAVATHRGLQLFEVAPHSHSHSHSPVQAPMKLRLSLPFLWRTDLGLVRGVGFFGANATSCYAICGRTLYVYSVTAAVLMWYVLLPQQPMAHAASLLQASGKNHNPARTHRDNALLAVAFHPAGALSGSTVMLFDAQSPMPKRLLHSPAQINLLHLPNNTSLFALSPHGECWCWLGDDAMDGSSLWHVAAQKEKEVAAAEEAEEGEEEDVAGWLRASIGNGKQDASLTYSQTLLASDRARISVGINIPSSSLLDMEVLLHRYIGELLPAAGNAQSLGNPLPDAVADSKHSTLLQPSDSSVARTSVTLNESELELEDEHFFQQLSLN
jgi:hypothetical protein